VIVGLAATALGCAAFAAGFLDRLYWFGYDLHCRWFSTIPADPRITMIDVDDHTLEAVPWPWERWTYAQLVNTLNELGAKAIVLDFVFDEPHKPRKEVVTEKDDDSELPVYGDPDDAPIIRDDDELREAMAKGKNVYLPMYGRIVSRESRHKKKHRITEDSFGQFTEGESFREFFFRVRPGADFEAYTADRVDVLRLYHRAKALHAAVHSCVSVYGSLVWVTNPIFPIAEFGSVAKGIGYAAFDRGSSSGTLRSVPPAVHWGRHAFMHLGFLVGADMAGLTRDIRVGRNEIGWNDEMILGSTDGRRMISSVDRTAGISGMNNAEDVAVLWNVSKNPDRWQESFAHLPATRLLELAADRQAIRNNDLRVRILRDELVRLRHADTRATYLEYVNCVRSLDEAVREPRNVPDRDEPEFRLRTRIKEIEEEAKTWLSRTWHLWEQTSPKNAEEMKERDQIQRLHKAFFNGDMAARAASVNERLAKRIDGLSSELGPQIEGKLCFVGYTASAVADLVTTPVYSAMPGVMAHANLCNMVLQNRFLRVASFPLNFAVLVLGGVATVLFGVMGSWRRSVLGAGALILVLGVTGAILFSKADYHLNTSVAVAQVGFVWTGVTIYRQGIEERVRRRLHRALAQYTSPEVADGIVDRVTAGDLAPQSATVTCFFCDLTGFTRLSERIGPEKTRDVLNPYLNTVSRILVKHGAIVNKFMGDGIFAFFNAPIRPSANHAEAACLAATEIAQEVRNSKFEVQREERRANGEDRMSTGAFPLSVRIGLATGEAFVGDYGSETKLDYTCIGDTVNLASRLEELNRRFSTTILVDAATRSDCGDAQFEFVERGMVEIEGREKAANVFELVRGRAN